MTPFSVILCAAFLLAPSIATAAEAPMLPSSLEARLDLIQASHRLENAQHELAEAKLRYSAARSGQQNKGIGLASFTNPGSRKRWQGAVETTAAEQKVAEGKVDSARTSYDAVRLRVCSAYPTVAECEGG